MQFIVINAIRENLHNVPTYWILELKWENSYQNETSDFAFYE